MTMLQCNGYENSNSNGIDNDYYKNHDNIAQGNFCWLGFQNKIVLKVLQPAHVGQIKNTLTVGLKRNQCLRW